MQAPGPWTRGRGSAAPWRCRARARPMLHAAHRELLSAARSTDTLITRAWPSSSGSSCRLVSPCSQPPTGAQSRRIVRLSGLVHGARTTAFRCVLHCGHLQCRYSILGMILLSSRTCIRRLITMVVPLGGLPSTRAHNKGKMHHRSPLAQSASTTRVFTAPCRGHGFRKLGPFSSNSCAEFGSVSPTGAPLSPSTTALENVR